jgi:hypothetical protein
MDSAARQRDDSADIRKGEDKHAPPARTARGS